MQLILVLYSGSAIHIVNSKKNLEGNHEEWEFALSTVKRGLKTNTHGHLEGRFQTGNGRIEVKLAKVAVVEASGENFYDRSALQPGILDVLDHEFTREVKYGKSSSSGKRELEQESLH